MHAHVLRSRSLHAWAFFIAATVACKSERDAPSVADFAELATRQLIAGLNAGNREVLSTLVVVTSTSGGAPRALTTEEKQSLAFPPGPYEYVGAGKPGTMLINDGKKRRRAVRLIRHGDGVKVLASNESFATYAARELESNTPAATQDTRVVSILQNE